MNHEIINHGPGEIEVLFGSSGRITMKPGQQFEGGIREIKIPKDGRVSFTVAPYPPGTGKRSER